MPFKNPDDRRQYQRERKRLSPGRPGLSPVSIPIPAPFRLKTAMDAINVLEQQMGAVVADTEAGTLEKARVIGYLVGVSLKAIEQGDLAARLEKLEAELTGRTA